MILADYYTNQAIINLPLAYFLLGFPAINAPRWPSHDLCA